MLLVSVDGPRPTHEQVLDLRGHMLHYVHQLILKGQGIHEDELQSVLNYLTTVHEVSTTQPEATLRWRIVSCPPGRQKNGQSVGQNFFFPNLIFL